MIICKKLLTTAFLLLLLVAVLNANCLAETTSSVHSTPTRIAFNDSGNLLVSDYTNGKIVTVNSDTMDIVGEFAMNGSPLGIAWADGLTYVGNAATRQVEAYNSFGQVQFVLGFGNVPVTAPQDIAINNDKIYVVDGGAKVVKIFGLDGIFINTLPESGFNNHILANPTAIAVDDVNNIIFVSDYGDHISLPRIQAFNLDGSLAFTIQAGSVNKYRFSMPQGLAVDKGLLYAVDAHSAEIHIFDSADGSLVGKVKGTGIKTGPNAMKLPLDLVIDGETDTIFVTNSRMAEIKVFTGTGGLR